MLIGNSMEFFSIKNLEITVFSGSFRHSLDSAGRFVVPQVIRNSIGNEFYLTKGIGCVYMMPEEYARLVQQRLESMGDPLEIWLNPDIARLHRHFYSDMIRTKTDGQNRLLLPPEHRKYSGIQDEIVVCGCGQYVELWQPEKLELYREINQSDEALTDSFNRLNSLSKDTINDAVSPSGTGS